jgi:ribosome assembly protein YihI (activator of Der GTPase)
MSSKVQQEQQKLNPAMDKNNLPLSETDPQAAKQKAAEDKLQLLATFQAMQREGKLPHNTQLHELLEKLITNKVISSREHSVSEDGALLLNDFRDLLRTLQKALAYKNKDELFQSLVYHLHCMESPISKGKI